MKLLHENGLPKDTKDGIQILEGHKNKNVDIEGINEEICNIIIDNLNEKVFFNQKVYCRGLANLTTTPKKDEAAVDDPDANANQEAKPKDTPKENPKPKTPVKNAESSHIPGLSKDALAEAAKKAVKKDKKKEKKNETPKPNPKNESKTRHKENTPNPKEGNIFTNLKADDNGDNDNDWTWAPEKAEE